MVPLATIPMSARKPINVRVVPVRAATLWFALRPMLVTSANAIKLPASVQRVTRPMGRIAMILMNVRKPTNAKAGNVQAAIL